MLKLLKIKDYRNNNLFHYRFFNDSNPLVQGVGSDTCEETAINKSISEFLEYEFARKHKKKLTTGISLHPDKIISLKKSKLELIERHYFLHSWFSNRNPQWLEEINIDKHYSIRLGVIADNWETIVLAGMITSTNNDIGFMLLLAAEEDYNTAKKKLILDSHRMITLIKRSDLSLLSDIDYNSHPMGNSLKYLIPSNENLILRDKYLSKSHPSLRIKVNHQFTTVFDKSNFLNQRRFVTITSSQEMLRFFKGRISTELSNFFSPEFDRLYHPIG